MRMENEWRDQAAPMARRCWKHSRQKTGRPWVGRKGTVVSLPHCEQLVLVSARTGVEFPLIVSARCAVLDLHSLDSFLTALSAKTISTPEVKTNYAPQSAHFKSGSWYSMEASPLDPKRRERAVSCTECREKIPGTTKRSGRAAKQHVNNNAQEGCAQKSK